MKPCLRPLLVCLALAFLASPALAQGKKYALLVGVKEYEHSGLGDLKYTEHDVEELASLLSAPEAGFEVVLLTTSRGKSDARAMPTTKNIRAQLKALSAKAKKQDLLLVALAGHGLQIGVTDPKDGEKEASESFFCPSDARPKGKGTLDELKQTMIPLAELYSELEGNGAGARLVLVDACRNELTSGSRSLDVNNAAKPGRGTAVLYSCKANERAFESEKLGRGHGVFFYHVIQGLKGQARNNRGEVTWSRLAEYATEQVSEQVPTLIKEGAQQTPHGILNIEGKSPVLLLRPEEKAIEDGKSTQPEKDNGNGRANKEEKVIEDEKGQEDEKSRQNGKDKRENLNQDPVEDDERRGQDDKAKEEEQKRKQEEKAREEEQRKQQERDEEEKRKQQEKARENEAKQQEEKAREDEKGEQSRQDATFRQGLEAVFGLKGPVNFKEGMRLLRQAAENKHPTARGLIGLMVYRGLGTAADRQEGERFLKEALPGVTRAAEGGDACALFLLATLYLDGITVEESGARARDLARAAADKEFAPAMRLLGNMAKRRKNHRQEVEWYRKAAALGYPQGMASLAECYACGRGVERDDKAALRWYRKAALEGHLEAMFQVAYCIERGRGVERDRCAAIKLYVEAARKGSTSAMYRLGCLYLAGEGVRKDCKAGVAWHAKAAAAGDERSMYALGKMWERGVGEKDHGEAMKWYVKAAARGHKPAQEKVRLCSRH